MKIMKEGIITVRLFKPNNVKKIVVSALFDTTSYL